MKLGVILPCIKLFGGVRRFLELGNALIRKNHSFVIFTPEGKYPNWFNFDGEITSIDNIGKYELDALFITETDYLDNLLASNAKLKIFYVVSRNKDLKKIAQNKEIIFFANSFSTQKRTARITKKKVYFAVGGIAEKNFENIQRPEKNRPFTVIIYGRLGRPVKGTRLVVSACERLYRKGYNLRLLLFDTPIDDLSKKLIDEFKTIVPHEFVLNHPPEKNVELFNRANVFVSAERKGGWANTAAEAMASGVPVIATAVGSKDFLINKETGLVVRRFVFSIASAIKKLYKNEELASKFAIAGRKRISHYTWDSCAQQILENIEDALSKKE